MDTDLAANRNDPPIKYSDLHMSLLYCTENQQTQRLCFPHVVLVLQPPFLYCNLPPEGDQNALVVVLEESHDIDLLIQSTAEIELILQSWTSSTKESRLKRSSSVFTG